MFYYLLYNSSFSFIVDNRLFSTVLYGSILYILTHAILNYCKVEILEIINNYFWFIFILDIISLAYGVYQILIISNADSSNNLDVSFNLLKNKINTIGSYFNKKNDISITDNTLLTNTPVLGNTLLTNTPVLGNTLLTNTPVLGNTLLTNTPVLGNTLLTNTLIPTPRQPLRISTTLPTSQSQLPATNPINIYAPNQSIQPTQEPQQKTSQLSGFSTPITALRNLEPHPPSKNTRASHIPEPIITSDENSFDSNNYSYSDGDGPEESIAGSDVGSIMDLGDFEKNL